MILQTYVYIILAILGTLALFSLVYVLVFKLKNEDAAFFTEEEISEDVKDMRAKLVSREKFNRTEISVRF